MELRKVNVGLVVIARKFFDFAYVEQVIPAMRKALDTDYSEVVDGGLVFTSEEAEHAVRLFKERGCDLVVAAFGTFADAAPAVTLATSIDVPLTLWSLAEPASETGRLRLNSLCGANLAGNALYSLDRPFNFVYGSPDDSRAIRKLQVRVKAAAVALTVRQSAVGLVGNRPDGYYACNFDEMELRRVTGARVEYVALADVQSKAKETDPAVKSAFVEDLRSQTVGMEKLDPQQVDATAGVYAAMSGIARERSLDAVAVRCWPEFFNLGHAACAAVGYMTDHGVMAGCEADVNGAVTMMAEHLFTGQPAFIADLVAIDEEKNGWILWHCGGQPASMANPDADVVAAYQPNRKLALALWFGARPGPVTVARLSYQRGKYRMLVMKGEALDEAPMYSQGISAKVRLESNAVEAASKFVEAGFEHHLIMCYGDVTEELEVLAEMWGVELVKL
ncbi:MAG TPA: L-fucose/L-arabinose isomerase family protein [Chloroflexota bacterium]